MAFKLTKREALELRTLIDNYELARTALSERLDEIASEWEAELEEKSDRWKESDAGQSAQENVDTLRGWHDQFPDAFDGDVDDLTTV